MSKVAIPGRNMIDNIRLEMRAKLKEVIIHLIDGSRQHMSRSVSYEKIREIARD